MTLHDPDHGTAAAEDRRALVERLRSFVADDTTSTHSAECWHWHARCAVLRAADLLEDDLAEDEQSGPDRP